MALELEDANTEAIVRAGRRALQGAFSVKWNP
jgi:hypothetical protein